MLLPGDTALADAIAAPTRQPFATLLIDWDGNGTYNHQYSDVSGWVQSIETERAATTDLPAAVSLVSGLSVASITAVLKQPAAAILGLWNTTSPLYGRPLVTVGVRLDLGFWTTAGRRSVRVFTGQLRSVDREEGTRLVTIEALDPSERLRVPITLPRYGTFSSDQSVWTVNTQWVIDYVLRRNGIYASPAARDDAIISCTCHGGLVAETGFNRQPRGQNAFTSPPWVAGPWVGTLAAPGHWQLGPYQEFFAAQEFHAVPGTGIGASGWVYFGTGMTDPDVDPAGGSRAWVQLFPSTDHNDLYALHLLPDGTIYGVIHGDATPVTVTAKVAGPVGWRYIAVHWRINTDGSRTVTIRCDGTTTSASISAASVPAMTPTWETSLQSTVWMPRPWCNFQVWVSDNAPTTWPGESHTSQADLGRGLGEMTHLPEVVNKDSLELISDVVDAELGLFGFDENGRAFFRPRSDAADTNTVDRTIATRREIKGLGSAVSADSVRNMVGWEAGPSYYAGDVGTAILKSTATRQFDVGSGTSYFRLPIPYDHAAAFVNIPRISSATWNDKDNDSTIVWGYAAVYVATTTSEVPDDGSLTLTFRQISESEGVLTVVNTSGSSVQFQTVDPNGRPALRTYGWPLTADRPSSAVRVNQGSVDVYGPRTQTLQASPWRSDPSSAAEMASGLAAQLASPIPAVDDIALVGDPRLQITDLARVNSPSETFRAYLAKVAHSFDASGGLATTVGVRPIAPPGLGIWNDNELGFWNSTFVWGP